MRSSRTKPRGDQAANAIAMIRISRSAITRPNTAIETFPLGSGTWVEISFDSLTCDSFTGFLTVSTWYTAGQATSQAHRCLADRGDSASVAMTTEYRPAPDREALPS